MSGAPFASRPVVLRGEKVSRYFGGLAAVSMVDFEVPEGVIFGLIGPNGAGKTTLFRVISGVYPPSTGRVFSRGKDISGLKPHQTCHLGITNTHQVVKPFREMTVFDNVRVGASFGRAGQARDLRRRVQDVLEFTGLAPKADQLARNLTLPDHKRLEIARALATHPQILLLDEVIAGLNPTEQTLTMALIQQIRDRGITVIMVEHVMKAVMGICEWIMVLNYGEKIAEGTASEIAGDPAVQTAYLGTRFAASKLAAESVDGEDGDHPAGGAGG